MNYVTVRQPVTKTGNGLRTLSSFDRLFDSVFNGLPGWDDRKPAVDIRTDEQRYTIEADLPGLSEEQIDVHVEDNLLVIASQEQQPKTDAAEPDEASETANEGFILRERRTGVFRRSFALPKDADAGNIEATYRNGVLTVVLNKKPEAKPRRIKISRGK